MSKVSVRAFIGLGSNLESPRDQVERALLALAALPSTVLVARSHLYRSSPMGPADQPDYINAVAALDTSLAPLDLLDELQRIETGQGRIRGAERWGPRTLDLDLLLYDDSVLRTTRLEVPHPGLLQRPFVLVPLHEIAPDLVLPDGTPLSGLVLHCDREGLRRLE